MLILEGNLKHPVVHKEKLDIWSGSQTLEMIAFETL